MIYDLTLMSKQPGLFKVRMKLLWPGAVVAVTDLLFTAVGIVNCFQQLALSIVYSSWLIVNK